MSNENERKSLLEQSKEDLVDLLLLALEGQRTATQNAMQLLKFVEERTQEVEDLKSKLQTAEAELIASRMKP